MSEAQKKIASDHMRTSRTINELLSGTRKNAFVHVAIVSIAPAAIVLVEKILTAESIGSLSRTVIYLSLVVLFTFGVIYFFMLILRERTANVSRLKLEVTSAFLKALDQSSFNPHRLEERNDQSSVQTKA